MSDDSRAIVPVVQRGVVASVSRQIAITEKVLGRILNNGFTATLTECPRHLENLLYTDPDTGLIWTRNGNLARDRMNWYDALNWVKNLDYCGYTDWRLPTKEELDFFVKRGRDHSYVWLNANEFNNVQAYWYWSSDTNSSLDDRAWHVNMYDGLACSFNKGFNFFVWPVRTGQR